jgi:hypothetical protein
MASGGGAMFKINKVMRVNHYHFTLEGVTIRFGYVVMSKLSARLYEGDDFKCTVKKDKSPEIFAALVAEFGKGE